MTNILGPRRVLCFGTVLLSLGIIFTSQVSRSWHFYLTYGVVTALGMNAAYISCTMSVVGWFELKRGLATGIAF